LQSAVDFGSAFVLQVLRCKNAFKNPIMENMNQKTNESVKTGMQIESDKDPSQQNAPVPGSENEKDPDDLVHEQEEVPGDAASGQDIDDLVHKHPEATPVNDLEEIDPDDLVHEDQNEEEER
jgi:hypothetical protein